MSLIDQTKLPRERVVVRCATVAEVAAAIRGMVVRGAPAIGVTAAYGVALAALRSTAATNRAGLLDDIAAAKVTLDAARPTAVNLRWATDRMLKAARGASPEDPAPRTAEKLLAEAHAIRDEDERMCRAIGEHGAALLWHSARGLIRRIPLDEPRSEPALLPSTALTRSVRSLPGLGPPG